MICCVAICSQWKAVNLVSPITEDIMSEDIMIDHTHKPDSSFMNEISHAFYSFQPLIHAENTVTENNKITNAGMSIK